MVRVSEALMKSITNIPGFASALHEAALSYLEYDDTRNKINEYFDTHLSNRPTKERERLNVCCASSGSYVDGLCKSLELIARNLDARIQTGEVYHVVLDMVEECPDKMEHYWKVYPDDVERPELAEEFVIDGVSPDDISRQ